MNKVKMMLNEELQKKLNLKNGYYVYNPCSRTNTWKIYNAQDQETKYMINISNNDIYSFRRIYN